MKIGTANNPADMFIPYAWKFYTNVRENLFMEEILHTLCLGYPPLCIMKLTVFLILLGLGFYRL